MDHLRITYDILHPRIDKLYETVRDYMIRMGWRDVELKGKIEVALLMLKMHEYTFKSFFMDFNDCCVLISQAFMPVIGSLTWGNILPVCVRFLA